MMPFARQELAEVLEAGWDKVDPTTSFPTFATSRPSSTPGRKPAGLRECAAHELKRWGDDLHRFPPYQYMDRRGLVNRQGEVRVPSVAEREVMLGFPVHYYTIRQDAAPRVNARRTGTWIGGLHCLGILGACRWSDGF